MTKTYEACAPSFGGRQNGETTKAYQAFTIYRNMGSARWRSLSARESLEKTAQDFYPTPHNPRTITAHIQIFDE